MCDSPCPPSIKPEPSDDQVAGGDTGEGLIVIDSDDDDDDAAPGGGGRRQKSNTPTPAPAGAAAGAAAGKGAGMGVKAEPAAPAVAIAPPPRRAAEAARRQAGEAAAAEAPDLSGSDTGESDWDDKAGGILRARTSTRPKLNLILLLLLCASVSEQVLDRRSIEVPSPRVCMSMHPEVKSFSDLGSSACFQ
jgi:hypothetical protein